MLSSSRIGDKFVLYLRNAANITRSGEFGALHSSHFSISQVAAFLILLSILQRSAWLIWYDLCCYILISRWKSKEKFWWYELRYDAMLHPIEKKPLKWPSTFWNVITLLKLTCAKAKLDESWCQRLRLVWAPWYSVGRTCSTPLL